MASPEAIPTAGGTAGVTIGVEEEFHIVDPSTGDSVPAARRVLGPHAGEAAPELQRTIVETASGVHTELDSLRADLLARRRQLHDAAARIGLAVVGAGTVPSSGTRRRPVFPHPRYEWIAQEYRQLVYEQQVCACQAHVGIADRDLAVRVIRRIRGWLPTLLALCASSPCFQGEDTGYASYRSVVASRWPTVGPPPDLGSAAAYDRTVAALIEGGVISDAGMIYFDARLSARYPTIEVRVADACPSVDDAVLLAALSRALVATAAREEAAGAPGPPEVPQVLLRAANWRAARSGLDGLLIDPVGVRPKPAAEVVGALLEYIVAALREHGDHGRVRRRVDWLLANGSSARRQRDALAGGASMAELVAGLAAETARG
jgi:glutamate---cysteine ligase / carboxylate-amine ligase